MTDINAKVDYYSWVNEDFTEYKEITETFLKEYQTKGRCAVDKAHNGWLSGDKNRFTEIDAETKKCNWCGVVLKKKTRLIEESYWEVENMRVEKPISNKKINN